MAVIESKTVTLKNGTKACIRTRTLEEFEKVRDCVEAIFSDDRFFMSTTAESKEWRTLDKYTERTELFNGHEQKLLLVVEIDGHIVSLSDIECGEKIRNRHIGRLGISIRQDYRSIGLGTAIIQTMINWATAHPDIEKLALGVWAANTPAIALYEKMGFVEEGRKIKEIKYADGTYDDCICMYRFVELA